MLDQGTNADAQEKTHPHIEGLNLDGITIGTDYIPSFKDVMQQLAADAHNEVKFKYEKGDVWQWIEENRIIVGDPWSWDHAKIAVELSEVDKQHLDFYVENGLYYLKRAPRPYFRQYLNEEARQKVAMKCRQCLTGNTTVFCYRDGGLSIETIEILYRSGYRGQVFYITTSGDLSVCNVVDIWESGEKDIYEIKTGDGRKIECSHREKIWSVTKNGFVMAENLEIGEQLKLYDYKFGDYRLDDGMPEVLGYMLSDGSFLTNSHTGYDSCYFRNKNKAYIDDFILHANEEKISVTKFTNGEYGDTYDVRMLKGSRIRTWFYDNNYLNVKNEQKKLPDILMSLNKNQMSILLNRLFAGDGYYYRRKRRTRNTYVHEIGIGSMSYPLLVQIQQILYGFDIRSSIKDSLGGKSKRRFWKLMVSTKVSNVLKFMEQIGIYGKIGAEDIELIQSEAKKVEQYPRRHEHTSIGAANISTIKKKPKQMTYDISVSDKEAHCFFANGILVSNSEFSETEINYALFKCITKDYYNVRHLFPTAGIANQVAKEKITVAIDTSPNIRRMLDRPYNLTEKKFTTYSFYTVDGAYNEHGGRGPSSEHIIFDEFNTHNPKIKEVYAASTEHARYGGLKILISTPTLPHMGIHAEFILGSQNHWHCTCTECGREQTLIFPDNIINFVEKNKYANTDEEDRALEQTYIGCRYCGAYIDKTSAIYEQTARWIAKFPMRKDYASYLITGMMLAWKTGKEINRKYLRMRFVHQFYNEVVGIEYTGDSVRVTKEEVRACQDFTMRNIMRRTDDMQNVAIGIDWGESESWLCAVGDGVGMEEEKPRLLFAMRIANDTLEKHGVGLGAAHHVDLAKKVIEALDADICVNDANGNGIRDNAKLRDEFGDRCWGAFYDVNEDKAEKVNKASVEVAWNENKGTVTIPRTVELMETMECFKKSRWFIPQEETRAMQYFVEHIHALTSTYYLDEETGKVYHKVQHIGPDHFAHAFTYARIGYEKIKVSNPRKKSKKTIAMSGG